MLNNSELFERVARRELTPREAVAIINDHDARYSRWAKLHPLWALIPVAIVAIVFTSLVIQVKSLQREVAASRAIENVLVQRLQGCKR